MVKKANVTTEKHFKMYQSEITRLLFALGLMHRAVDFEHTEMAHSDESITQARFCCDAEGQWVSFVLNTTWGSDRIRQGGIKRVALHETFHYLLDDLIQLALKRTATEEDIRREEHRVINRLINATFGKI